MLRQLKLCGWAMALMLVARSASAFALYGPLTAEEWQQIVIGYREGADGDYGVDIATPRNLGEEYRWNTPVLYYAFDSAFLDYFGSNGVAAVEQAFAILNDVGR